MHQQTAMEKQRIDPEVGQEPAEAHSHEKDRRTSVSCHRLHATTDEDDTDDQVGNPTRKSSHPNAAHSDASPITTPAGHRTTPAQASLPLVEKAGQRRTAQLPLRQEPDNRRPSHTFAIRDGIPTRDQHDAGAGLARRGAQQRRTRRAREAGCRAARRRAPDARPRPAPQARPRPRPPPRTRQPRAAPAPRHETSHGRRRSARSGALPATIANPNLVDIVASPRVRTSRTRAWDGLPEARAGAAAFRAAFRPLLSTGIPVVLNARS